MRLTDNFQVGFGSSLLNLFSGRSRTRERDLSDLRVRGKESTGRTGTVYDVNYSWWEARQGNNFGEA